MIIIFFRARHIDKFLMTKMVCCEDHEVILPLRSRFTCFAAISFAVCLAVTPFLPPLSLSSSAPSAAAHPEHMAARSKRIQEILCENLADEVPQLLLLWSPRQESLFPSSSHSRCCCFCKGALPIIAIGSKAAPSCLSTDYPERALSKCQNLPRILQNWSPRELPPLPLRFRSEVHTPARKG